MSLDEELEIFYNNNVRGIYDSMTINWGNIIGSIYDQHDLIELLNNKQPLLESGVNIKTINGISLLGSGNIEIKTYLSFPNNWVTHSSTSDFCDSIINDEYAVAGTSYLGQLNCSDLPDGLVQAETIVEIISENINGKAINITLSSVEVPPYRWVYSTAKVNGRYINTGWKSYQLKLPQPIPNKYLHANAFTGELEWTEAGGGSEIYDFQVVNSLPESPTVISPKVVFNLTDNRLYILDHTEEL